MSLDGNQRSRKLTRETVQLLDGVLHSSPHVSYFPTVQEWIQSGVQQKKGNRYSMSLVKRWRV